MQACPRTATQPAEEAYAPRMRDIETYPLRPVIGGGIRRPRSSSRPTEKHEKTAKLSTRQARTSAEIIDARGGCAAGPTQGNK
jgi:hypothetical protein